MENIAEKMKLLDKAESLHQSLYLKFGADLQLFSFHGRMMNEIRKERHRLLLSVGYSKPSGMFVPF